MGHYQKGRTMYIKTEPEFVWKWTVIWWSEDREEGQCRRRKVDRANSSGTGRSRMGTISGSAEVGSRQDQDKTLRGLGSNIWADRIVFFSNGFWPFICVLWWSLYLGQYPLSRLTLAVFPVSHFSAISAPLAGCSRIFCLSVSSPPFFSSLSSLCPPPPSPFLMMK